MFRFQQVIAKHTKDKKKKKMKINKKQNKGKTHSLKGRNKYENQIQIWQRFWNYQIEI